MRWFGVSIAMMVSLAAIPLPAQSLMPWPASISIRDEKLLIDQSFRVALTGHSDPRLEAAAIRLLARLSKQTGMLLEAPQPVVETAQATLVLHCQGTGNEESYQLSITSRQARLEAASPLGILRGIETFLQLLETAPEGFAVAAVEIRDQPRLAWRGLLIDVSRHFMPIDVIKRNLDGMAAVKLNVLHWHLVDDQGFRVESKRYPRLHEMGSDGYYYTQDQIREIISYAGERGIRVMPEFDVPGHTTSWLVGHPELASNPGPYEIDRTWGILRPTMDPSKEAVYEFLDNFIGEMAALFPDEYFHIGGDEVSGKDWDASARISEFKKQHGFKDNHDLQAYFNRRVQEIVKKHGKKMIGWDEILHPDLPRDVVIHSWRGEKTLAEARKLGFTGILSAGYYLDHMQPAAFHYRVDPEGAIGGEACMWAEYVTPETIDSRIWPRTAAIAERFWSPGSVRDEDSMYQRLAVVSRNLEWLGLTHRSNYPLMLQRLAGTDPIGPLQTLADVLEPVKMYARSRARRYTTFTPLNRLVDAARPESDTAREFARSVNRFLGGAKPEAAVISRQLTLWRDNYARLAPTLQRSFLLQEITPLSQDLAAISTAGLEALKYLQSGRPAPPAWVKQKRALLKRAQEGRAELLIMVAPPIQRLVESAR